MLIFQDLSHIYNYMGYQNEAVVVADRAVGCLQSVLGPESSSILAIKTGQAKMLSKLKRYSKAAERWGEVSERWGEVSES
jgi:hypothetical protein